MEFKIKINSVLLYTDKTTKEEHTRISYQFLGKEFFQVSDKFIGISEQTLFVKKNIIEEFNPDDIKGRAFTIKVEEVPTLRNPLKKYTKITEIKLDDAVIVSL